MFYQILSLGAILPMAVVFYLLIGYWMNRRMPEIAHEEQKHPQIQRMESCEIPALTERLPDGSWYRHSFTNEGRSWKFEFVCNFAGGHFAAHAYGETPKEAFSYGQKIIEGQLHEWHRVRFQDSFSYRDFSLMKSTAAMKVLVIDDDIDAALATRNALQKLGYEIEIATQHRGLHRKIAASDADYILLDWKLDQGVTADMVMQSATNLIDHFSDLQEKFWHKKPRIVTYSALDKKAIHLPASGAEYFEYEDHWQKPMSFPEVMAKASDFAVH